MPTIARALINTPALPLAEYHMTILLASHDPQIAARSDRLIRLRDGAGVDDIDLTADRPVQDVIRHVGQLG
jgi:putative ABC transport system ATP-binding protein